MAYQPVPNVAELKATYRQGTNLMSNTFHVLNDAAWTVTSLNQLATLYKDWDNLEGKQERAMSVELTHITVADLTAIDAPYVAMAIDPAVGGLNAGQALPLNVTLAVTAVTGTRGRGRQGRTFWIGLTENQVDENVVTNTTQDNIVDDLNALMDDINGVSGWTMVIVHRYVSGVKLAVGTTTPIVTYAIRDTTVDSQRNRLPNHRRASSRSLESLCAEVIARGGTCTP